MKALLLSLAAVLSGTGLVAYAEGPSLPAGESVPSGLIEKAIGACLILGGSLEGARRMAQGAKADARAAKIEAMAAAQAAESIGRKLDRLTVAYHDERERRAGWEGEMRGSDMARKERIEVVAAANHQTRDELGRRLSALEERRELQQGR